MSLAKLSPKDILEMGALGDSCLPANEALEEMIHKPSHTFPCKSL
jgi:hypothetical protein